MSSIDPKLAILHIAQTLPEGRVGTTLTDKVKEISAILQENPDLKRDFKIVNRVLTLTGSKRNSAIRNFRRELIYNSSCNKENGIVTLAFPEKVTDQEKSSIIRGLQSARFDSEQKTLTIPAGVTLRSDQLWKFIKAHDVEQLIIQQGQGMSIVYSEKVLGQLLEKKPSFDDLTEKYTLKLFDGEVIETKAKLFLCGNYFEGMMHFGGVAKEKKEVDLAGDVSYPAFRAILDYLETGEMDHDLLYDDEFKLQCDFLQFSLPSPIPEGAFGPAEWQKYYGIEVDDVPPVPHNIDFDPEKEVMALMPTGLSVKKMGKLIRHPKTGHATEYQMWDRIAAEHGSKEVENSYWFVMSKEVEEESLGKTRDEQLKAAEEKGGRAPTLLEAIVACSLVHVATGERILSYELWRFTVCQEMVQGVPWKLVVGGFSASGLGVSYCGCDANDVGAAVLRKF